MKVIDLHCDTLSELRHGLYRGEKIDLGSNHLQVDLEKLKKGDYLLQCFALFINLGDPYNPLVTALEQVDLFRQAMRQYPQEIRQVTTWEEFLENRKEGRISALLTVEEGGCCLGNLSVLRVLYSLGVRIMTLTWNYENDLAWPNEVPGNAANVYPCAANTTNGLKEKGLEFISEMERLGMLIDVSHLSDAGFWDVYHHTRKPFIASHSNARALCGHVRNLTDEMIRAIADRGGLTGLNYCASFLDPSDHPRSTVQRMAEHAAYIRNVGGIDCLGLGSDFDGIEGDLEMPDASYLPMLEAELRRQHFTEDEIEKIFFRNAMRVLKEVLA
ncbi:MAG: dipeptidase [Parasporobacterium sp.]|nr:dipeptidase [Parasporobacterium sp.]